ncbi:MAG: hypothetical protein HYX89_00515 [Chloroflexi bacterium]|nr:hypothetical protein [Chloroflexota bacterium]
MRQPRSGNRWTARLGYAIGFLVTGAILATSIYTVWQRSAEWEALAQPSRLAGAAFGIAGDLFRRQETPERGARPSAEVTPTFLPVAGVPPTLTATPSISLTPTPTPTLSQTATATGTATPSPTPESATVTPSNTVRPATVTPVRSSTPTTPALALEFVVESAQRSQVAGGSSQGEIWGIVLDRTGQWVPELRFRLQAEGGWTAYFPQPFQPNAGQFWFVALSPSNYFVTVVDQADRPRSVTAGPLRIDAPDARGYYRWDLVFRAR